jgi:Leucine-rich repeat (LRR) protein
MTLESTEEYRFTINFSKNEQNFFSLITKLNMINNNIEQIAHFSYSQKSVTKMNY